ncbi:hypothetical protein FH972_022737 [Carpinus fangiana]|uniref:Major facilitator superfamily (MFS) profile domain-containing protein n=1 Tax=Carpinus fangiana TaxID=176857 RepID=A0A5N6KTT0_9ROSI|nr:hypothetical protein FH972_022737 [Carpinus fangiana]
MTSRAPDGVASVLPEGTLIITPPHIQQIFSSSLKSARVTSAAPALCPAPRKTPKVHSSKHQSLWQFAVQYCTRLAKRLTTVSAMDQSKAGAALVTPAVVENEHASKQTVLGHSGAIWETRQTYGPTGIKGLLASPYVAACAAFSALGGLLFGYDQGVVSVILVMPQFLDRIDRVADGASGSGFWKGLLTAMIELGALIGALNQGWIADKYSRKYSIVIAVVIFTVGSVLQTGAVDYAMLTVARFIGGIGIGMLSMVAPLYISEISPPEIRGTLLVLEEFSIVLGIVIAYWITFGTRFMAGEWSWRLPFFLQLIPGFVLGAGILFLPFSPRWLVSKGRNAEALSSLSKLRGVGEDDERVLLEWYDIQTEVRLQQEVLQERHPSLFEGAMNSAKKARLEVVAWLDLFKSGCRKRTHAACGIMWFQQFVGINALIYYSPTLFASMGQEYEMQLVLSGVLNVTQLVGVTSSIWTMDRFGRKPLLLWGAAFMFISHFIISILVGLYSDNWPAHRTAGWVSVAFLFIYMLAFGASWGPVPWAYPAEVFPSSLRAKGVGMSTATNWFTNFIIGLITPPLLNTNRHFGAYVFFAIWCLLALLWTIKFIKETKGRSLEQMDAVFGDNLGEKEVVRRQRIEREVIDEASSTGVDFRTRS